MDSGSRTVPARFPWLAASVFFATLLIAIFAWLLVRRSERHDIHKVTLLITSAIRSELATDVSTWIGEEVRLAKIWEFEEPSRNQWGYFAQLYSQHHAGCQTITWVDSAKGENWITTSRETIAARVFSPDEITSRLLDNALQTRQPVASNPFITPDGQKKWLAVVPVYQKDRFRGFVIASFDLQQSVNEMLKEIPELGFSVALDEGDKEVFKMAGRTDDDKNLAETSNIQVPGTNWHLRVWPTSEGIRQIRSSFPQFVLGSGLILTLLFTSLAYAQTRLRGEIAERRRAEEALRHSQARFAGILEISPAGVISTDEHQRITLFNHEAEKIFGYKAVEILGQHLEILIPEHFRAVHRRHFVSFAESDKKNLILSNHRLVFGRRRDGTEFPMAAQLSKLDLGGEKIFTVLCSDVTRQVRAEEKLLGAHDELEMRVLERTSELRKANTALKTEITEREAAEEEIRQLSGKIMRLQDEERRNIARELHDGAAQNLVSVTLNLNRLLSASSQPQEEAKTLEESLQLVEQCTNELRTISYLLHPPMLEELGLGRALRGFVEGFCRRSGIDVTLNAPQEIGPLDFEVQLTVFRIVQEALSNIFKHSHSPTASITLSIEGEDLRLEIADQGSGIAEGRDSAGVGLGGMKERVRLLQGRLGISTSSMGTVIKATIPLTATKPSTKTANEPTNPEISDKKL